MYERPDVRRAAVSSPRQAAAARQCLGARATRISGTGCHRPDRGNRARGVEVRIRKGAWGTTRHHHWASPRFRSESAFRRPARDIAPNRLKAELRTLMASNRAQALTTGLSYLGCFPICGMFPPQIMRYLVKARVKPGQEKALLKAIADGTLGHGSIAGDEYLYDLQQARAGDDGVARWVETCFCATPLAEDR